MSDLIVRNQAAQREMLAAVDRFVVLTQWALEAVAANGAPPGKLALNRLGVSQTGFSAKPTPDRQPTRLPITVGYLGRLEPVKGVHDLVRAAASLPSEIPIRVEIRGPLVTDDERAYLRELRMLAGADRRIAFSAPGACTARSRRSSRATTCSAARRCAWKGARPSRSRPMPPGRR